MALALQLCFGLPLISCFNLFGSSLSAVQIDPSIEIQPGSIDEQAPLSATSAAQKTNSLMPLSGNIVVILSGVYVLFLAYKIIRLCRAWRLTQAIRRSAFDSPIPENIAAIVDECQSAFSVEKVRILCSPAVTSPLTIGAFDPLIIFPEKLLTETDRNLLLAAAGHELAHIRRRDYLLNLLYEFIYLFISFHLHSI